MNTAPSELSMPGGKAACRAQAEAILRSPAFARSQRMQRLLRFLVDETLAGRASQLKEYTIAVGVFDRPSSFDPGNSAVVRVEAGRLRRLLDDYRREYGHDDEIELVVPKGSYVPVFRLPPISTPINNEASVYRFDRRTGSQIHGRRLITIVACRGSRSLMSPGVLAACEDIAEQTGCALEVASYGTAALYFGWPASMADGAEQALIGARSILSSSEDIAGVQIGVATGEVEIDSTPTDLEARDVILHILDLAERLAARAPNDAILISESTRRATRAPSTLLRPVWSKDGRWTARDDWSGYLAS